MSTLTHKCHAKGCRIEVDIRMLMCKGHWSMVPEVLQKEVWRCYKSGQELRRDFSPEWLVAANKAIAAVEERQREMRGRGKPNPVADNPHGPPGYFIASATAAGVEYELVRPGHYVFKSPTLTLSYWPKTGTFLLWGKRFFVKDIQSLFERLADDSLRPKPNDTDYWSDECEGPNCKAPIVWYRPSEKGRRPMPCDMDGSPHWATCKDSDHFRSRGQ